MNNQGIALRIQESPIVRFAIDADLPLLPQIEAEADGMFRQAGIILPPGQMSVDELRACKAVFVIGQPIAGFLCLDVLDGQAHLEQIAVRPGRTGQGLGTALIAAAIAWAMDRGFLVMTLTTYRDVPWNGPYYARRGFQELGDSELGPGLLAARMHERELGLDDLGPRIAMRLPLQDSSRG